jgi:ParB-like nuclease domain
MNKRGHETVRVSGKAIDMLHKDIPIGQVELDDENPRIRYRRMMQENQNKSLDELILDMPEVKALRRSIEKNEGLRDRIIVLPNGKPGRWKVVEGNCRTVCYRLLARKDPTNATWKKIPARILPAETDRRDIAILLSDYHVAGKIKWGAHEKAGQIHHMHTVLQMPLEDIALHMRSSKSTVLRCKDAYQFMFNKFLKIDGGKYAAEGEARWSYFDELFKRKELRAELRANPTFGDEFCRHVGEGRIGQPVNVRKLPKILTHPEARKVFLASGELERAWKIVQAAEPEEGSDFFKLLAKLREACTSAAQIGEIIKIRNDKVARQRVLDTHKALVEFMALADVKPGK